MSAAFLAQFFGSLVAIGLLVLLARWIGKPRARGPLTEELARALFAEEFPDAHPEGVYVAQDRKSAFARSGDEALLVYLAGDGWVARSVAWSLVAGARRIEGAALINLADPAAPQVRVSRAAGEPWPPTELSV